MPQWFAQLVAAASAGVTASSIRVPTEVVKSRMQMGQFPSPTVAIRSIIQKEGVRGLYAGFQSFLVRDIVFDVIEFVSYEQMKTYYMDKVGRPKLTAVEGSAIGAVAGALTATFTTPLDVIKTRMMLQGTNKVYSGVLNCTVKMIQEEGVAALFKVSGGEKQSECNTTQHNATYPCLQNAKCKMQKPAKITPKPDPTHLEPSPSFSIRVSDSCFVCVAC